MRRWILGEKEIFISFISLAGLVVSVILLGEEREYWAGLGLEDSIENTEQETNEEQFYFITNTYIH